MCVPHRSINQVNRYLGNVYHGYANVYAHAPGSSVTAIYSSSGFAHGITWLRRNHVSCSEVEARNLELPQSRALHQRVDVLVEIATPLARMLISTCINLLVQPVIRPTTVLKQ